jgi:hypothetical protein
MGVMITSTTFGPVLGTCPWMFFMCLFIYSFFLNTWLQTSHVNCVISLTHWRRCVYDGDNHDDDKHEKPKNSDKTDLKGTSDLELGRTQRKSCSPRPVAAPVKRKLEGTCPWMFFMCLFIYSFFLNTWLQTSHVNCVISLTHWRRCVFSCSSLEKYLLVNVEDLAQGSGTIRPRRKIRSPERYGDFVYK